MDEEFFDDTSHHEYKGSNKEAASHIVRFDLEANWDSTCLLSKAPDFDSIRTGFSGGSYELLIIFTAAC